MKQIESVLLPLLFACAFLTSCVTPPSTHPTLAQLPDKKPPLDTPELFLPTAVRLAVIPGDRVTLPSGVYVPIAMADDGIFYHAKALINFAKAVPAYGGLFIPTSPSEKQKLWLTRYYCVELGASEQERQAASYGVLRSLGTPSAFGAVAYQAGMKETQIIDYKFPIYPIPQLIILTKPPVYTDKDLDEVRKRLEERRTSE